MAGGGRDRRLEEHTSVVSGLLSAADGWPPGLWKAGKVCALPSA